MPSAASPDPRAVSPPPAEDIDNLFTYDDAVNDFLTDIPLTKDNPNTTTTTSPKKDVDEEVIVRKKRAPVPKLDANLLQTPNGLPKLRKVAKTRLKFRGKGHEFTDMAMLLNAYQLWLDDLYPRAKFRDALAMVEKAGHGKRMTVMRRAWLDETKPGAMESREGEGEGEGGDVVMSGALPVEGSGSGGAGAVERNRGADAPDDDELDALLAEGNSATKNSKAPAARNSAPFDVDESDDDLDALMAETEQVSRPVQPQTTKRKAPFEEDEDEDEDDMDALLAEHEQSTKSTQPPSSKRKALFEEEDDDDDQDELDALLAEQSTRIRASETNQSKGESQQPAFPEPEDDFAEDEAAMAEMGTW